MTDLADRQAAASRQGKAFEDTVELLLLVEGRERRGRYVPREWVDDEVSRRRDQHPSRPQ